MLLENVMLWKFALLLYCTQNVCTMIYFILYNITSEDSGSTVVKVLRYKSEGRWFDPRWCHGIFHGPGIDSASNRNEYQEYYVGVNAVGT
jgi:hypothetical protein